MKSSYNDQNESSENINPNPKFIAQQLRKPSGDFAQQIGEKMNRVNAPLYDLTFDVMKFDENEHVLEIGFGTGKFFHRLMDNNENLWVSGIDYSREMLEIARETNHDLISKGKLTVQQSNSKSIPFSDQSFDKIFCNMVIYFWDEPENHLNEIRRVLKPEGLFYTGMRTKECMLDFPFVEHGFHLYTIMEWKEILNQNGFNVTETLNRSDPEIEMPEQDQTLQLESCCIVAKKIPF